MARQAMDMRLASPLAACVFLSPAAEALGWEVRKFCGKRSIPDVLGAGNEFRRVSN